jgi:hypothetical protein
VAVSYIPHPRCTPRSAEELVMLRFGIAVLVCSFAATLVGCAGSEEPTEEGDAQLTAASATSPITIRNWLSHPKIVEIRSLVHTVDTTEMAVARRDNLCESIGESSREKRTDGAGKVRKLALEGGADDSAAAETYYYDAAGHLRFAFEEGGDVHGGAYERRVYFAPDGARIWEVDRSARTPDHHGEPDLTKAPFVVPDPETALEILPAVISDPKAAFDAPPLCN